MICPQCGHFITDDEYNLVDSEWHQDDIHEVCILVYECPKCKHEIRCE